MNNGQPPGPMYGRRQHEMPYNPQAMPPQQHPYHGYPHQAMAQHYAPQPHPHWAGYYMQPPMSQRPYPAYPPPMMSAPYYMPQPPPAHHPQSMSPRPGPPHHINSSNSVRSHQSIPPPSVPNPPLQVAPPVTPQPSAPVMRSTPPPAQPPIRNFMPFYPQLPWYSCDEQDFPRRGARRKRAFLPQTSEIPVEFPSREETEEVTDREAQAETAGVDRASSRAGERADAFMERVDCSTSPPTNSAIASTQAETISHHAVVTEPGAAGPVVQSAGIAPVQVARSTGKAHAIVPVVPHIPSLNANKKPPSTHVDTIKPAESASGTESDLASGSVGSSNTEPSKTSSVASDETHKAEEALPMAPPKSWADLVRSNAPTSNHIHTESSPMINNGFAAPKNESLADAVLSFEVKKSNDGEKISFLKPRGLVNTGNMCYMNSVLQILVSNVPFYDFLDRIGRQSGHSFKSDTPMLDAMIMFLHEFPVIDSATSVEQLNMRLKDKEFEEYGEAFIPEFVYDVIRRLPRFASMRRGHQQDAEEFLGFLLEQLHEECVRAMKMFLPKGFEKLNLTSQDPEGNDGGWLEVGPKQKASVTRSSGINDLESPITKIFGGKLRSELRVPGAKNSVTLEPYQPLQLDIGSPYVNNIVDALKNLTKPETLHGDFDSPRGPGMKATKQVFVETLPPVLILHLKRFQYDSAGTQKIWKKVGYPLELEIPKEVFPPHKRGGLAVHGGLPQYRLVGVVYHHGKIANGGHYTVDVRRQNEREWIRLDDTVIRRVRSEEVAEGGNEEDPKVLAAALEQHRRDQSVSSSSNIFDQVREESEEQEKAERGWNHVNGGTSPVAATSTAPKKWSGIVNGTNSSPNSSGKHTPVGRYSVKDNKVAYLLFYQRLGF